VITGIGIDAVYVKRMYAWLSKPSLMERFFHPEELSSALDRGDGAASSLAARFAAKEAFGKALGSGLRGIVLKDIMVKNKENGQPEIVLFSTALKALNKNSANKIHLSLTHEKDNAMAMVVLENVKT